MEEHGVSTKKLGRWAAPLLARGEGQVEMVTPKFSVSLLKVDMSGGLFAKATHSEEGQRSLKNRPIE